MKKLIIIFIISIAISSSLGFAIGYFIHSDLTKSDLNKNFEIQRLNNLVVELKKNLVYKDNKISELNEKIKQYDNCICETTEYTHPIEIVEKQCMKNATNAAEYRNCVYKSEDSWKKEISKYLQKLKSATTDEEYKTITESQDLWLKQNKKDRELVEHFIFNHGGTIYFDFAASDTEELVKNRANFLKWIYDVHTDNLTSD